MKKKSLWLLSGCPGSGKTTKAKELVISLDDVKYVSRDEIRFSILNAEDEYFAKEADVFNKFVREIQKGIDNYENTIADATFLNWPSRRKLLLKLKNLKEVNVNILQFTTPLDVCLERNEKREGRAKVPEEAIRDMYEKMTHPSKDPFSYYITGEVVSSGESIFS